MEHFIHPQFKARAASSAGYGAREPGFSVPGVRLVNIVRLSSRSKSGRFSSEPGQDAEAHETAAPSPPRKETPEHHGHTE